MTDTKLQIVCGWCQQPMGEKDGEGVEGETTGICDNCLRRHFPHQYAKVKAAEAAPAKRDRRTEIELSDMKAMREAYR